MTQRHAFTKENTQLIQRALLHTIAFMPFSQVRMVHIQLILIGTYDAAPRPAPAATKLAERLRDSQSEQRLELKHGRDYSAVRSLASPSRIQLD
jgi:hypothetical protein